MASSIRTPSPKQFQNRRPDPAHDAGRIVRRWRLGWIATFVRDRCIRRHRLIDLLRLHASRGEHDRTGHHRGRESRFPDSRHIFRFGLSGPGYDGIGPRQWFQRAPPSESQKSVLRFTKLNRFRLGVIETSGNLTPNPCLRARAGRGTGRP